MKVELELKNGRRKVLPEAIANVLVKRNVGYVTREIRAQPGAELVDLDTLRAEADRRGIAYHHRTGAAKLRELLAG